MDKIANVVIAAIVISCAAVLGYWWQDRTPPTAFIGEEILTPTVRPGDRVVIRLVAERRRTDCEIAIDRIFFDGANVRFPLESEHFRANPGALGRDEILEAFVVPEWAAPGTGRIRMVRAYYCNPLQHWFAYPVVVRVPDAKFQIVR